jgi:DNA-binding response OmpR family regulator
MVLRRSQRPEETVTSSLICGELEINFARRAVKVGGQPVALTRTEYELLHQLALSPNCVLSHTELLSKVWGAEYRDDVDYLRAYIRYLRKKLEPDPAAPRYILTQSGVGYLLACPESDAPA